VSTITTLRALIEPVRQLLKGKRPASSDEIGRTIATFDEQLAERPAQRAVLEREWADALLDATVQDQAAHRAKLEAFDLETEQGTAARDALQRRLAETIVREESDRVSALISRGREVLEQSNAMVDQCDAAGEAYRAALAKLHGASQELDEIRHVVDRAGRVEELLQDLSSYPPAVYTFGLLTGFGIGSARKHTVTRLRDDAQLWPPTPIQAAPMISVAGPPTFRVGGGN
jgi:hypothetical protein